MRLPATLKEVLVYENEAFKKGLRFPTAVPRKPSVVEILNQYVRECQAPNQAVNMEERVSLTARQIARSSESVQVANKLHLHDKRVSCTGSFSGPALWNMQNISATKEHILCWEDFTFTGTDWKLIFVGSCRMQRA